MTLTKAGEVISVDYALKMTRLPIHFYALLNNLSGRDVLYQNPGVSLRSFIVHFWLDEELFALDGEMLEALNDCERFSNDSETVPLIIIKLNELISDLIDKVSKAAPEVQVKLQKDLTALNSASSKIVDLFDAEFEDQALTQHLFDTFKLIIQTGYFLESFTKTKA